MSEADVSKVISKFEKITAGKKSMDDVAPLLEYLEKLDLPKETLSKTRIGLILNDFRKKIEDEKLAKRAKYLIKKWKQIMEATAPPASNGTVQPPAKIARSENGSRKTTSVSTPPPDEEPIIAKKPKVETPPPVQQQPEKKVKQPEQPSTSVKLPPRDTSLKAPYDEVRVKSVAVLANSLKAASYPEGTMHPEDVAIMLEDAIFMAHSGDKYSSTIRSRVFNLRDKRNPSLRENVLVGSINPERFATMPIEEMASTEMKKIRDQFTKEAITEHQMAVNEGTPSDMFSCGKCKRKNCTYTQLQTRSADEPMTTFVYCRDCGNRWKFC